VTRRNTGRGSGTATKVTVGTAMGIAGFFAGAYVGFLAQNGATTPGDGRAAVMTGGLVGAGAGAALGVWLASR